MNTTTLVVIIWTSFLLGSRAWGPITHLYLCSLAAERSGNETMHTFLAGCSSPDSLKEEWPELHSLEFAARLFGYAVQQRKQNGNHHNSTYSLDSTTDNLIEFALGFGCHIANDEVGHHTNGFLNPPALDHVIEFNLDSMIFHEKTGGHFESEYVMSEHAIDLILKAATPHTSTTTHRYLRKKVINSKPIDRARIQSAINHFKLITSAEHALIRIQPPLLYKSALKRDSFCNNVSNYQEVVNNFDFSADWAVSTCLLWRSTLWTMIKRGDLDDAAPVMHRAVNELFRANNGTSCVL